MSRRRKRKRKQKDCGNGSHHEVSPMGHATRTLSQEEKKRKEDKRKKTKRMG